uniref:Transcription factor CBF/NF-Y/archaeal histone domain-containing protein n=2 Tax=Aegilops tauschii subsp. strangulata TaxID=200361 RepID=A0A453PGF9_AEGTS
WTMGGSSKKRGGQRGEGDGENPAAEGGSALPMANVVRLMRRVLPSNVKIAETAKQLTHDCAVEFVGFVGGEASERARSEHRRTVAPEDFTWSCQSLGFDSYVQPMETYLRGYREYDIARGRSSRGARPPAPPAMASFLPPGQPVTVTEEELEFLRSVVPPPPEGY